MNPMTAEPVETLLGKVAGEVVPAADGPIFCYRGIPYAAPPVGPRRWRHAEPAAPWTGVRMVTRFAPDCPQPDWPEALRYLAEPRGLASEDCLYLNIWTPVAPSSSHEALRPVMIWIHGGGLIWGRSSHPLYNGAALAKKGVVVVTFNYRLGIFGFLSHPELTAESPDGASGNYAIGDQVAALRWVPDNIGQFGGDPNNVTIFGESAGCVSVHLLTACPSANGLFHRAAGHSASYLAPMMTLAEAEAADRVPGATEEPLAALRELPASEILRRAELTRFRSYTHAAIVDGHLIHRPVRDIYERGEQIKVPLLLLCTADEGSLLPQPDISAEEFSREVIWRPMLRWADLAASSQPVYFCFFSHIPAGAEREVQFMDGRWGRPGAFHTSEISFVFNNECSTPRFSPNIPVDEPRKVDLALAELMSDFWVAFARYGAPKLARPHDEWGRYGQREGRYYEFCANSRSEAGVRERLLGASPRV